MWFKHMMIFVLLIIVHIMMITSSIQEEKESVTQSIALNDTAPETTLVTPPSNTI